MEKEPLLSPPQSPVNDQINHEHLCPFPMCFQYHLMVWILNKLDCRTHMLINHLL